jgi:hypothetical protein
MRFGLGSSPTPVDSGTVQLKRNANETDNDVTAPFITRVNRIVDSGKMSKSDYKELKDSMVNGRESLNQVLERVGVANTDQLKSIFGRGHNHSSVTISPMQKEELRTLLTDNNVANVQAPQVALTQNETTLLNGLNEKLSCDRSDPANRYSVTDLTFSPEVSGIFKKQLQKEFSVENMDFLMDLKLALNPPNQAKLNELYHTYLEVGSDREINVSSRNRAAADRVFDPNNNATFEQKLTALTQSADEITSVLNDPYLRFVKSDGMAQAIFTDAMNLPADNLIENKRLKYLDNIISANGENSSVGLAARKAKGMTLDDLK